MQQKISDDLILINTMMIVAKERGEILRLSSQLNSVIEKALDLEKNSNLIAEKPNATTALIEFTDKEIDKMSKQFRKTFKINGCVAHVRKRTDKRYNCSYEIRYARKPYDIHPISASATTLAEAKLKFIEKVNNYVLPEQTKDISIPTNFHEFSMFWFSKIHARKVKERTYDHDIKLYNRHIKSKFEKFRVRDINMLILQNFLDNAPGKGKTAKDLHSILKQILDCAVKHGLIKLNPIGMCFLDGYEQEHGTAISINDERKLLAAYAGTKDEFYFAVILYTGLRPCEYTSAVIDGNFIKAENRKRKSKVIEYKRIPITPMLRPYLNGVTKLNLPDERYLTRRFKKVLPAHMLYDMRTTFQTRCDQCKIEDRAIGLFMGNEIGKNSNSKLKKAYTDITDPDYLAYLFEEGQKFEY